MKHKINAVSFLVALLIAISVFSASCADSADTNSDGEGTNIADNVADAVDGTEDDVVTDDDNTETESVYDSGTHISASHDYADEDAMFGFNGAVSFDDILTNFGFDFASSDYIVAVERVNSFDGGFYEKNGSGDAIEPVEVGASYEMTMDELSTVYWSMSEDMVKTMLIAADSGRNVDSLIITACEDGNIVKAAYVKIFYICDHTDGFMDGYEFYAVAYDCVTFPKAESGEYQNVTIDSLKDLFSLYE